LYFYGVTKSLPKHAGDQIGVDAKATIEPVPCEGFICWISRVSAEEFEANLAKNMENLDWLAAASISHQRAIAAIAAETEILPARFGIVFHNRRSMVEHVKARVKRLSEDFNRIKGADEWGVKVQAVVPKPVASAIAKAGTGKDYLKAKAALLPRKTERNAERDRDLEQLQNSLSGIAEQTASAGKISSGQRGLLFQTSLLVKRRNRPQLESLLRKYARRWEGKYSVECSGPWPPYSFVSRDGERQ
jgi:hypothetical protein